MHRHKKFSDMFAILLPALKSKQKHNALKRTSIFKQAINFNLQEDPDSSVRDKSPI